MPRWARVFGAISVVVGLLYLAAHALPVHTHARGHQAVAP
jgi:hypothetical protein